MAVEEQTKNPLPGQANLRGRDYEKRKEREKACTRTVQRDQDSEVALGRKKETSTEKNTSSGQNLLPGLNSIRVEPAPRGRQLQPKSNPSTTQQRVHTDASQLKTKPDDWRKKHEQLAKKKPEKSPDMRTYHPMPGDYTIFDNLAKQKTSKSLLGKV